MTHVVASSGASNVKGFFIAAGAAADARGGGGAGGGGGAAAAGGGRRGYALFGGPSADLTCSMPGCNLVASSAESLALHELRHS